MSAKKAEEAETNPVIVEINQRIKDLCAEKHVTQKWLATKIGLAPEDFTNRLSKNNSKRLTFEEFISIAEALDMSLSELFDISNTRKSARQLSPRDVCKMLADIYDSDYGFVFESASEENGTRIYFASPSIDSCFPGSNLASFNNYERGSINAFFEKMKKIADMREADRYTNAGFNDEMYETLLNEYLSAVDDLAEHAEGQQAFIEAMYKSGAKPLPYSVEEAGIKELSYQDHLKLKEASEQGLIELEDVSDMLPDPEEITAYKKKYPDAFPESSGEVKSSKKKKREQD